MKLTFLYVCTQVCTVASFCKSPAFSQVGPAKDFIWQLGLKLVNLNLTRQLYWWLRGWSTFSCAAEEWRLVVGFSVPQCSECEKCSFHWMRGSWLNTEGEDTERADDCRLYCITTRQHYLTFLSTPCQMSPFYFSLLFLIWSWENSFYLFILVSFLHSYGLCLPFLLSFLIPRSCLLTLTAHLLPFLHRSE